MLIPAPEGVSHFRRHQRANRETHTSRKGGLTDLQLTQLGFGAVDQAEGRRVCFVWGTHHTLIGQGCWRHEKR